MNGEKNMHIQPDNHARTYEALVKPPKKPEVGQTTNELKSHPKEVIELSTTNKRISSMLSMDKGTAANTTLYVDNTTFQKIATYSTNHPDTKWSELGSDETKRWIVINGQRFESPKSEEEKALAKRAQMTLMDHLQEYEDLKEETKPKKQVTLNFLLDDAGAHTNEHPKIKNLVQNEQVMEMLKNISKGSNGKIAVSY